MKTKLYTQSGEWQGTLNVGAVSKRLRELADAIDSGDILLEDTSESTIVGRQDFTTRIQIYVSCKTPRCLMG